MTAPRESAASADAPNLPAAPIAAAFADETRLPLPSASGDAATGDDELWRVDDRVVSKSDLGDFVLRYLPDRAADALDQLLDAAVIDAEAKRESVTVSDEAVRERTDAYVEERRRDARVQYGAKADFESLIKERYGRDFASYRADAARLVRTLLLRERLVRLDQLREDGVEVRVLVLESEDAARAATKSLREGADMTLYADRVRARRPACPAPFARGEIPEKDIEAKLFAAAPGDVLDPAPFQAKGVTYWQVFKVARAWKATGAPWSALAAPVEDSLRAAPATPDECRRWRRRAFARHRVEQRDAAKGFVRGEGGR